MTNELELIKRALRMGIGTHGDPCGGGETCRAMTEFCEALAAVERLEAQHIMRGVVADAALQSTDNPQESTEGPQG